MNEIERCPRCQSLETVRVDPERNLFRCVNCGLWFGE
jgi:Zn ribbon nucleic-acid-binding protein